jgi:hypothetical protein
MRPSEASFVYKFLKIVVISKRKLGFEDIDYIPFPSFIPLQFSHRSFIFWPYHDSTTTLQMALL